MISIVIPVLNEEAALPLCLSCVMSQAGEFEVIVVDGGSSDRSREIAADYSKVTLLTSARGRAMQMNAGAGLASGEWLLFLHADTLLPDQAVQQIECQSDNKNVQAGCFCQQFSGDHRLLRAISWLHNWRCRHTRIMYGDQCIFIRRSLFEQLGGFPATDILEDVMLSEAIVKISNPLILGSAVITDSRKFEQRGICRSFAEVFIIMSCYELGLPILGRDFFSAVR